jgi:hypothetical protein
MSKHDIATLERLGKKFGDVKLSEAVENLKHPRNGHPLKWNVHKLADVWLGVEAIKAVGIKPNKAFNEFATFSNLTVPKVKYAYGKARRRFRKPPFIEYLSQSIDLHVKRNSSFRAFLRKLEISMKTPRIQ